MPLLATNMPAKQSSSVKKRRTATEVDSIRIVAAAESGGDSLSTPVVASTLSRVYASNISSETRSAIENALRELRADLDGFSPPSSKLNASSVSNYLRKVDLRIKPSDAVLEGTAAPQKLGRISVVGSFLLGYASPTAPSADVAVVAPTGFFGDRDVANFRYHQKRALFLAYIAQYLEGCGGRWDVSITGTLGGNLAKPVLQVSRKAAVAKFILRILPGLDEGVIPADKLNRRRRNVRKSGESSIVDNIALATPKYNDSILMDSCFASHLHNLHHSVEKVKDFVSAIRMLGAWCGRRRLFSGSFIHAVLVASLLKERRLPGSATGANIFRVALARIAAGALEELELCGVLVCSQLDAGVLARAKEEAAAGLVLIDAPVSTVDPWRGVLPGLFVTARGAQPLPAPLSALFDGFVRVQASKRAGKIQVLDGSVRAVLHKALVQVCRAVRIEQLESALFGISLSSVRDGVRKVDLCPDSIPEEEFQAFWGDKAQLRRFNDGKIKRALVWNGGVSTMNDIVQHAAARHLHKSVVVTVVMGQLQSTSGLIESNISTSTRLHAALNELGKTLRGLEGLPLRILSVAGVSTHLRGAAVQEVRPHYNGKFIEPVDVIASFESSKSWPSDPVAVSASKAAFYVALRGAVADQGLSAKATISYLDILLGDFVFRIRISVEEEKTGVGEKSADRAHLMWLTEERIAVHSLFRNARSPLLGPVSRLAKKWFSSHLLYSQLGDRSEEFVELLCLRSLEGPHARPPCSVFVGFFRFLHLLAEFPWETAPLVVSSTGDGVDIDDEVTDILADPRSEESYQDAFRAFEARRDSRPGIGVTCPCNDPYAWFDRAHSPDRSIVSRMVATAQASLQCAESILSGKVDVDGYAMLFRTPIEGVYHLALDLDLSATPRAQKLKKGFMRSGAPVARLDSSFVGFNPAEQLLEELKAELDEEAWFMFDAFGGACIYVGWRPRAMKPRSFSIRNMRFSEPNVETGMLEPDRKQMVSAMLRIGQGFISNVRYLKEDESLSESME